MFRADLKISANKDQVLFYCANCREKLVAISNQAHQNNFLWVVLAPLLALVVLISLHNFIPAYIRPIYYFFGLALTILVVVVKGQHKMTISRYEDSEK